MNGLRHFFIQMGKSLIILFHKPLNKLFRDLKENITRGEQNYDVNRNENNIFEVLFYDTIKFQKQL